MFRILVVEDDNGIRMLMEDALADAGYEPVLACNGLEALEVLESKHVDLIILDIMMPKTGRLRAAQADPRERHGYAGFDGDSQADPRRQEEGVSVGCGRLYGEAL